MTDFNSEAGTKEAAPLPTNQPNYIKGNKAHTGQEETSKDQWRTPKEIINFCQGYGVDFTLDAAASSENAICEKYFSIADNALIQSWETSGTVWCNPPYSNIGAWINKAIEESEKGAEIIMLVPNSTDTAWFKHALNYCDVCLVVGGRVGFINADSNMKRSANTRGSMFLLFPMAGTKPEYMHVLRSTLLNGGEVVA